MPKMRISRDGGDDAYYPVLLEEIRYPDGLVALVKDLLRRVAALERMDGPGATTIAAHDHNFSGETDGHDHGGAVASDTDTFSGTTDTDTPPSETFLIKEGS